MTDDFSKLGLTELFDELIQPDPPADISMFPATAGWIWFAAALILVLFFVARKWLAHRRNNAYRRKALQILRGAKNDPLAIATLLRETALAGFPRADVAGLIGDEWLAFLDQTAGKPLFVDSQAGQTLIRAPYSRVPADPNLTAIAYIWIRAHHSNAEKLKAPA